MESEWDSLFGSSTNESSSPTPPCERNPHVFDQFQSFAPVNLVPRFNVLSSDQSNVPPPPPTSPVPCEDCRILRKRCDKLLGGCTRCVRRKAVCRYRDTSATKPHPLDQPANQSGPNQPNVALLVADQFRIVNERLSQMEANIAFLMQQQQQLQSQQTIIDHTLSRQSPNDTSSLELEELDLMPTMNDWVVVQKYLSMRNYSVLAILGRRTLLESFFSEPPGLRLTFCAIAAHFQTPRLPQLVCLSYYSRAQKALLKEMNNPSLKTFQALMLLSAFTFSNGQPMVGRPFFFQAVRMLFQLRLNVDPDNSPWLGNISEEEKQERRLGFWVVFHSMKLVQILVSKPISVNVDLGGVKPPLRAPTAHPPYKNQSEFATVYFLGMLLDALRDITKNYNNVPTNVSQVLDNPEFLSLHKKLLSVQLQIPSNLILVKSMNPSAVNNVVAFTSTFLKHPLEVVDTLLVSFTFHSALCVLYRPLLICSGYSRLDSHELLNNQINVGKILTAIDTCTSSARTILHLHSWLKQRSKLLMDGENGQFFQSFWKEHMSYSMTLFEPVIVLWFITCRTKQFWWRKIQPQDSSTTFSILGESLRLEMDDRKLIRSQVLDVLSCLQVLENVTSGGNMISPMVVCVKAMLREMEEVEREVATGSFVESSAIGNGHEEDMAVDSVTIGMKVMSLVQEDEVSAPYVDDPWVLLGLLGLEVKGLRWLAHYEEGYRALWNSC
ncbi:UNVERIFIED_CONTAM: hypothetical protein HDU68_008290 [Siphonaria sp. JEL0065]|nr:hypothetical protein HDU68_008290 [Siphonaria sp. JEL0065]